MRLFDTYRQRKAENAVMAKYSDAVADVFFKACERNAKQITIFIDGKHIVSIDLK